MNNEELLAATTDFLNTCLLITTSESLRRRINEELCRRIDTDTY
jgi:hypothetical protein